MHRQKFSGWREKFHRHSCKELNGVADADGAVPASDCRLPWRRRVVGHRLYKQIYFGLMSVVLCVCLVIACLFWIFDDDQEQHFNPAVLPLLTALLPADASVAAHSAVLANIAAATHGEIALYDATGQRISTTDQDFPQQLTARGLRWAHHYTLPDGRQVLLRWARGKGVVFLWLASFAVFMAIAAWPVSRRLSWRLERMQAQADAWGEGRLSVRMSIDGCDEVAEVARRFNQAAARVEALVNSQRAMLASASHELRSPLARIRMAIDLIGENRPDLQAQIARDIAELDALIGDLLLASRLADESPRLNLGNVDLLGLAAEEAARFEASASGEAVTLQGDARLLRHLLRNLLDNARRYAPGTAAEVEVRRTGTQDKPEILLRVLDRGPGVPDAECENIFEPFYRLQGSAERGEGSGYGLALVRRIAHLHGGTVRCLPRESGGTCFELRLPVAG